MRGKFIAGGIGAFGDWVIKKMKTRAGNQGVNAEVQGTCATIAKRTILTMNKVIQSKGYDARFMFPVHDELIYSVHKDQVVAFLRDLRAAMCSHPDLFKSLVLDASVAIGRNFGAYDSVKNPYGQLELDEFNGNTAEDYTKWVSCIPGLAQNAKLNEIETQQVVDYLTRDV